jgi:hypothetical protein
MHEYVIRVLKAHSHSEMLCGVPGRRVLIWAAPHPSTFEALRMARRFAGKGDIVEVWRDHDCVFRETVAATAWPSNDQ